MNVAATITVERNDFAAIAGAFGSEVADAMNRALYAIQAAADPLTPVDEGYLRSAIAYDLATPDRLEGAIGWEADYAVFQELGTVHIAPQRFAGQAADQVMPEYVADLRALEGRLG